MSRGFIAPVLSPHLANHLTNQLDIQDRFPYPQPMPKQVLITLILGLDFIPHSAADLQVMVARAFISWPTPSHDLRVGFGKMIGPDDGGGV
jgi:hypothetical protein